MTRAKNNWKAARLLIIASVWRQPKRPAKPEALQPHDPLQSRWRRPACRSCPYMERGLGNDRFQKEVARWRVHTVCRDGQTDVKSPSGVQRGLEGWKQFKALVRLFLFSPNKLLKDRLFRTDHGAPGKVRGHSERQRGVGEAAKGEDGASAGVGASAGLKTEAELPQGHNLASPTHTHRSLWPKEVS